MPEKWPSQVQKLYALLFDFKPHRSDEIVREVYGEGMTLARLAARVYDAKKKYSAEIRGWKDHENPALYFYKLLPRRDTLQRESKQGDLFFRSRSENTALDP